MGHDPTPLRHAIAPSPEPTDTPPHASHGSRHVTPAPLRALRAIPFMTHAFRLATRRLRTASIASKIGNHGSPEPMNDKLLVMTG